MVENSDIDRVARAMEESFKMTPPENSWKRLDAELDKKQAILYRKKANRFRLLSLGLALLLLFFVAWHYLVPIQVSSGNRESDDAKAVNAQDEIMKGNRDMASVTHDPGLTRSGQENAKQVIESPAVASITEAHSLPVQSVHSGSPATKDNSSSASTSGNTRSRPPIAVSHPLPVSGASAGSSGSLILSGSSEPVNATSGTSQVTEDPAIHQAAENTTSGAEQPAQVKSEKEIALVESGEQSTGNTGSGENPSPAEESGQLRLPASSLPDPVSAGQPEGTNTSDPASSVPKFCSGISVDAFYSPEYTWMQLKDNDRSDGEEISEFYDREKFESSFSFGFNVSYGFNDHWSVSLGGSYSEVIYSMTYSTIYVDYGFDGNLHYMYPTSFGVVVKENTGTKVLHAGDSLNRDIACTQLVKVISVPLKARYRCEGARLTWFGEAGLRLNTYREAVMNLTIGNNEGKIINNVDGLKEMNFGYSVGCGAEYKLGKGFGFFLAPELKGSINSITEKISVKSYPYSIGVNAGLHYRPLH